MPHSAESIAIFWFRRDLRLADNAGLCHALKSRYPVLPIFIFDRNILDKLESRADHRVAFIHQKISELDKELRKLGSSLYVVHNTPLNAFQDLVDNFPVREVFTNHDYEPYATQRDTEIAEWLASRRIEFHHFKDQVIFEKDEVLKDDGNPYTVFTPYSKKWKSRLNDFYLQEYPVEKYYSNFLTRTGPDILRLTDIGFERTGNQFPGLQVSDDLIKQYSHQRDYPAKEGTSRLGVHLRFGTISIRKLVKRALALNETYLNELIWREFYQMILWHHPQLAAGRCFRPEYEYIPWRNNSTEFQRWCEGSTGYPIVDAGMRELNQTGYMHNRVRMITASFLSKHLLIDWRWGEAYFAGKLLDFDLASNNGGWQWAAGCGCDAAPYFRIFNPTLQTQKFDAEGLYLRKWVPEMGDLSYPQQIVPHDIARKRCLEVYSKGLKQRI